MIRLMAGKKILIMTSHGLTKMEIVKVIGDRHLIVKAHSPLFGALCATATRNVRGRYVKSSGWFIGSTHAQADNTPTAQCAPLIR